jgi:hypothetical protein
MKLFFRVACMTNSGYFGLSIVLISALHFHAITMNIQEIIALGSVKGKGLRKCKQ